MGRRGRRPLQREALSLRTSDRVTGVAIRYPPPPSAREVSARSGDGGRDSAYPTAGHMGPALQSTAGMLTERRPLRNDRRSCPYNGRRGRPALLPLRRFVSLLDKLTLAAYNLRGVPPLLR